MRSREQSACRIKHVHQRKADLAVLPLSDRGAEDRWRNIRMYVA